jgi:hypothetical protein
VRGYESGSSDVGRVRLLESSLRDLANAAR